MAVTHPQAQLTSFRVHLFEGSGTRFPKNAQLNFDLAQEVEVGYTQPKEPKQGEIRGLVRIKLLGALRDEANLDGPNVQCKGMYEAFFEYARDADVSEVMNAYADDNYTLFLVAQVFPLAVQHLKTQLTAMEIDNDFIPLGLKPETQAVK